MIKNDEALKQRLDMCACFCVNGNSEMSNGNRISNGCDRTTHSTLSAICMAEGFFNYKCEKRTSNTVDRLEACENPSSDAKILKKCKSRFAR